MKDGGWNLEVTRKTGMDLQEWESEVDQMLLAIDQINGSLNSVVLKGLLSRLKFLRDNLIRKSLEEPDG